MNRTTAFQLLNLPSTASPADIRKQYQQLYTAFQAKITNAPNPVLKQKFERNFAKIQEAYQVLQQQESQDDFLPSSEPVTGTTTHTDPPPEPAAIEASDNTEAPPQPKAKMSKAPILVAIFALAAAALFIVFWLENKNEVARLSPLETELEAYKENFQNRPFQIENASENKASFKVYYYKLFYIDDQQQLQKEEGYPDAVVAYGRSFSDVQKVEGSRVVFDGQALFYTFVLMPTTTGYPYFDSGVITSDEAILVNPVFN